MNDMYQPDLFADIDRAAAESEHIKTMRACWPDWDGPKDGYYCQVAQCTALEVVTSEERYHYGERCRLIEKQESGEWLAVIESRADTLERSPHMADDQGIQLLLPITNIWPPCDDLWDKRNGVRETDNG